MRHNLKAKTISKLLVLRRRETPSSIQARDSLEGLLCSVLSAKGTPIFNSLAVVMPNPREQTPICMLLLWIQTPLPELFCPLSCHVAATATTLVVIDTRPTIDGDDRGGVGLRASNPSLWTEHLTPSLALSLSLSPYRVRGRDWLLILRHRHRHCWLAPFLSPSLSLSLPLSLSLSLCGVVWKSRV